MVQAQKPAEDATKVMGEIRAAIKPLLDKPWSPFNRNVDEMLNVQGNTGRGTLQANAMLSDAEGKRANSLLQTVGTAESLARVAEQAGHREAAAAFVAVRGYSLREDATAEGAQVRLEAAAKILYDDSRKSGSSIGVAYAAAGELSPADALTKVMERLPTGAQAAPAVSEEAGQLSNISNRLYQMANRDNDLATRMTETMRSNVTELLSNASNPEALKNATRSVLDVAAQYAADKLPARDANLLFNSWEKSGVKFSRPSLE